MKWTPEQYAEWLVKKGVKVETTILPKPSKYHNIITECDSIRFQSKKEAAYYRELCCRRHAGEVNFFLRQVPFHLQGGVKYVVDFVEFHTDGSVRFVDVKGHRTEMYRVKKRLVEASYPIKISEA
jgi:hypothetical protein